MQMRADRSAPYGRHAADEYSGDRSAEGTNDDLSSPYSGAAQPSLHARATRFPVARVWGAAFIVYFFCRQFVDRPRRFIWAGQQHTADASVVTFELSVRYASLGVFLLLASRAVAARVPVRGAHAIAVPVIGGLALAVITTVGLSFVSCFVVPWGVCEPSLRVWVGLRLRALPEWLILNVSLILAWMAARGAATYREAEIRSDVARSTLSKSGVSLLTNQLRPHFLFNTLQSVATLMHRDVSAAAKMLDGLRNLFETTCNLESSAEVTLDEELELLQLYTEIEAVRFGPRLQISVHADQLSRSASVPQLLLQPLVENSILHGFAQSGAGSVTIEASVDPAKSLLIVEVRDNGVRAVTSKRRAPGLGLDSTRTRLEILYPGQHRLDIESVLGQGTTVRIQLPYKYRQGLSPSGKQGV